MPHSKSNPLKFFNDQSDIRVKKMQLGGSSFDKLHRGDPVNNPLKQKLNQAIADSASTAKSHARALIYDKLHIGDPAYKEDVKESLSAPGKIRKEIAKSKKKG